MLITEGLLLLAMASAPSPTTASASSHPVDHQIVPRALVAQAEGWRGNPPPPPLEEPVGRRRPGFVWVEGGFDWRRGRYIRHRGHWERVHEGRQWHGGHWEWPARPFRLQLAKRELLEGATRHEPILPRSRDHSAV